jgi:hypothetical protein
MPEGKLPPVTVPERTGSRLKSSTRSPATSAHASSALPSQGFTESSRKSSATTVQDMSRSSSNSSENTQTQSQQPLATTAQTVITTGRIASEITLVDKPAVASNTAVISKSIRPKSAQKQAQTEPAPVNKKPPELKPPVLELEIVPAVDPAPPSGMYWSKAPVYDRNIVPLRAHTASLVGSNIFVFGGCDSKSCFHDLYVFDADAMFWSKPVCTGEKPPPLRAMTTTTVQKKLLIFGGGDGPTYYNDVFVFDTLGYRYSKPKISGSLPSKRRAHTACLYKNGLYVFGGGDGVRALNDVWRLDVSDSSRMSWKLISAPSVASKSEKSTPETTRDGKPTARGYHTANMVGSKLIIYGGSDGVECFKDVWIFDVETLIWKCVDIRDSPARLSHTATIVGSYLFVIGGHDGVEYSNEVLLLNLVTMLWDHRKVYGLPPSGRGYHGAVLHDSRLFITGGFDG